jgi:hypothetical protein
MPEMNVVTAIPVGILAALIWGTILLQRLFRSQKFQKLTKKQRFMVGLSATVAFLPSLLVGFAATIPVSHLMVSPGPWNHLTMAVVLAFMVGIAGSAIPGAISWLVARILIR